MVREEDKFKFVCKRNRYEWGKGKWQEEWNESEKGRMFFKYFPEVDGELKELNKKGLQMVTGHGNFGEYLEIFKLKVNVSGSECGAEVESIEHIVNECGMNDRIVVREKAERE